MPNDCVTSVSNPINITTGKAEHYMMRNILRGKLDMRSSNNVSPKHFAYTDFDSETVFGLTADKIKEPYYEIQLQSLTYTFNKNAVITQDSGSNRLTPPHGSNLIEVIQTHSRLRQEIAAMFERYGQKLQLRMDERRLEIIKDQDGIIYSYPYSSVADTLQRIIFYLAAIESNDDAVLLFEEPEAHSFPVYVSKLGRRIVESRNNQFFIDTHSPYLITEILETMLTDDAQAGELAMFAAYYEDHQTKVHQLSDEEIRSIRADGIDVFYNMKRFTTGAAHNA
ncbi:AAA family ATPase [Hymenobacter frigidus]|nr:AAA family ATPase [Hymenobacter frigidus]